MEKVMLKMRQSQWASSVLLRLLRLLRSMNGLSQPTFSVHIAPYWAGACPSSDSWNQSKLSEKDGNCGDPTQLIFYFFKKNHKHPLTFSRFGISRVQPPYWPFEAYVSDVCFEFLQGVFQISVPPCISKNAIKLVFCLKLKLLMDGLKKVNRLHS